MLDPSNSTLIPASSESPLPTTVPEATTSTFPPLKPLTWIPVPADPMIEPLEVTEMRRSPSART